MPLSLLLLTVTTVNLPGQITFISGYARYTELPERNSVVFHLENTRSVTLDLRRGGLSCLLHQQGARRRPGVSPQMRLNQGGDNQTVLSFDLGPQGTRQCNTLNIDANLR